MYACMCTHRVTPSSGEISNLVCMLSKSFFTQPALPMTAARQRQEIAAHFYSDWVFYMRLSPEVVP